MCWNCMPNERASNANEAQKAAALKTDGFGIIVCFLVQKFLTVIMICGIQRYELGHLPKFAEIA